MRNRSARVTTSWDSAKASDAWPASIRRVSTHGRQNRQRILGDQRAIAIAKIHGNGGWRNIITLQQKRWR